MTSVGSTTSPPAVRRLGHPFWSEPLAADAPLATTSSDYAGRLAYLAGMVRKSTPIAGSYNAPYNAVVQQTDYARTIYVMPPDAPRVKIWARSNKPGLRAQLDKGFPMPDPALIPDGNIAPAGTDGATIIVCGHEALELWQPGPTDPAVDPAGYAWRCTQGGYIADTRTHPGWWAGSAYYHQDGATRVAGQNWGVSASGQSYLGSTLTAEDYYAETIRHPLSLSLPLTGGTPPILLPATRYDAKNFTTTRDDTVVASLRLPEGARFRLPADFDVDAWVTGHADVDTAYAGVDLTRLVTVPASPAVLRKILVCLRDYGLLIGESAGVVAFIAEAAKVFGTPYHPYAFHEVPVWGNFTQQLPWSSFVQVAPPTLDISTKAG